MDRAYSLLTIKSIDEEQRIIEGIASTPETDRMGDIVEPMGAQFSLPMPLLWQHESGEAAIGDVTWAKPNAKGIPFKASIQKDDVPGILKDRLDYAWRSIKLKLVRGVSIGFTPVDGETEAIPGTYGLRFKKWNWHELSAVTIPAAYGATIATVKSFDIHRAASGAPATPPGASGTVKSIKSQPGARQVQTTSEQIKDFEATRAAKSARMDELMAKAAEAGETLDASQAEEYDGLESSVAAVDKHLVRLRAQEERNKAAAVAVQARTTDEATQTRAGIVVVRERSLPPGIRFARVARLKALSSRYNQDIEKIASKMYPDDGITLKAVSAGATDSYDGTWADPLVGAETNIYADFVEFLRPMTILGKFGAGGIPSLRRVPFRVPLIGQTTGGTGYWVGEGKPKPLTKFDFERKTLLPLKVANIAVVTEEVLRSSAPSADAIVRDQLAAALGERMDLDFINPDMTGVPGVSPDSITKSATPIPSSGNDIADVIVDIKAIFDAFIADNNAPTNGVWIMSSSTALALALMQNPLGQPAFPGITMNGGTLYGLPVITSQYVPTDSTGAIVVLANASDIYFGDEGGIMVDVSREASLEMSATPTNDSVTPTATSLVSMFQTNSVAFRAERIIDWMKRRDEAVQYLSAVNWGAASS